MFDCEHDVSKCPIFRVMNDDERNAVLDLSETLTFQSGEAVISEGRSTPQGVWLIRSGHVEVVHPSINGERQVNYLGSGAIFGEVSFFDPQEHSATIRVVESAEMFFFPAENFQVLMEQCPSAAHQMLLNLGRLLAQKLRKIDKRLISELLVTSETVSTTRPAS